MSGYVALRRPLAGAVVTCFVTVFRTSPSKCSILGHGEPKARHDHDAVSGRAGDRISQKRVSVTAPVVQEPHYQARLIWTSCAAADPGAG